MTGSTLSLALLGQPNSGKSTLFNRLTGSHQHVGNWPGKTVEQKTGSFTRNGTRYEVCDLPGSYSLSAQSQEERVTQDYIESGGVDVIVVMADASQLSRSLYMLADVAGIEVPCVLVLNMMDVARSQGKSIDVPLLESRLGVPVVPLVANGKEGYDQLTDAIDSAAQRRLLLDESSMGDLYRRHSPEWVRSFEGNAGAPGNALSSGADGARGFGSMWLAARDASASEEGAVSCAEARFAWVDRMLEGVQVADHGPTHRLARLDGALLSRRWGKLVSTGIILLGLIGAMLVASPVMMVGMGVAGSLEMPVYDGLSQVGTSEFLAAYVSQGLVTAVGYSLAMAGFCFGATFVFGLLEETGVVARISYAFDDWMSALGLQGKVIMPFMMSLGCTMAGVTGTRVVDSWGQRLLATMLSWAVPCGATFAIIPTIAIVFFGPGGMALVILGIFAVMTLVMLVISRLFGRRLNPEDERSGLVMELPPYHRPKFLALLSTSARHGVGVFRRALAIVIVSSTLFWVLSWSPSGGVEGSMLYAMGHAIEPVTRVFGMGWKTFIAFLASMFAKEASLGVLSALCQADASQGLYAAASAAKSTGAASTAGLAAGIPPAEALAYMFAVTFNVPCAMALSTTYSETHSGKWTAIIGLTYFVLALLIAFVVYHVAVLFM